MSYGQAPLRHWFFPLQGPFGSQDADKPILSATDFGRAEDGSSGGSFCALAGNIASRRQIAIETSERKPLWTSIYCSVRAHLLSLRRQYHPCHLLFVILLTIFIAALIELSWVLER